MSFLFLTFLNIGGIIKSLRKGMLIMQVTFSKMCKDESQTSVCQDVYKKVMIIWNLYQELYSELYMGL